MHSEILITWVSLGRLNRIYFLLMLKGRFIFFFSKAEKAILLLSSLHAFWWSEMSDPFITILAGTQFKMWKVAAFQ